MKIKFLIIISFLFLLGCGNLADTKKDTVINNNQTASAVSYTHLTLPTILLV